MKKLDLLQMIRQIFVLPISHLNNYKGKTYPVLEREVYSNNFRP
jgi:hypothetical protein